MKLAAAFLFTFVALAQGVQDLPEIRGTVAEYASTNPVSGAQVTLSEFVAPEGTVIRKQAATVFSNEQGAFSIKPTHAGHYYIQVAKPLYLSADEIEALGWISGRSMMETPLDIPEEASSNLHFTLIRPGGLTGQIIDENDKPVPNFTVTATGPGPRGRRDRAVTDKDGVFTFPAIIPTPRVIRVGPANELIVSARSSFTKNDLATVVQDVETTYWPGGVSDPALALPLNMIPGAVVSIGTIRLHKVPYYRAHVTFSGECGVREGWMLTVDSGISPVQCSKELLLDRSLPGSHTLGAIVASGAIKRWALVPFSIDHENVEVAVTFQLPVDLPVRIFGADSAALGASQIGLRSTAIQGPEGNSMREAPASASFTIEQVAWPQHQVYFSALDPGVAIKQIRYANQPVPDGIITLIPGASLEIVIDDQPASLSGAAPPQSTVYIAKWPFVPILERPFTFTSKADASGKFQVPALTAGEYRVIANPSTNLDAAALGSMLSTAPRITLEKGATKTIELK